MLEEPAVDDINQCIAARVRALRAERGMSLETLAAKCTVSRSMLSLIERGESSPTSVVLNKIATGLGVSLASLFDNSAGPLNPLSKSNERTKWQDPQSGYIRRNISPPNFRSPIQIVEVLLPPGAYVMYETGPHQVDIHQQVWLQEGNIEITVGKVTHQLVKDDCLAMQLDAPIAFKNTSRKSARYIVVLATESAKPK